MEKYEELLNLFRGMGNAAVAFSGGVDSTLLLFAAREALGEKAAAFTVVSGSFPLREQKKAEDFCRENAIPQYLVKVNELDIPGFRENPPDRCYLCKKELFSRMREEAEKHGFSALAEGSNQDDLKDYRPGMRAIRELGVRSPLQDVHLTKEEIRLLCRKKNLKAWSKPSYACLATRFLYGDRITDEKLAMVDQAEQLLLDLGFPQMRVRCHGNMARIEVLPELLDRFLDPAVRETVSRRFHELGFIYVAVDLDGYRTGSMNNVEFAWE